MIGGLVALLVGMVITFVGWQTWRYRNRETISLLEAGILRATGEEPLPRNKADTILNWAHIVFGLTLGPLSLFIGIVAILYQLDLL